jgi:hypothetical protein
LTDDIQFLSFVWERGDSFGLISFPFSCLLHDFSIGIYCQKLCQVLSLYSVFYTLVHWVSQSHKNDDLFFYSFGCGFLPFNNNILSHNSDYLKYGLLNIEI